MADPKTELAPGETVVHEGRANLQRGAETVGGRAWLTETRLIVEPHKANIQSDPEIVELADVRGVTKGATKFLGFIPLAPNAVVLDTTSGEVRLTVTGRAKWIEAIEQARVSAR